MAAILAHSHRVHGLLWRYWTLIYLGTLVGMVAVLALELLGYHYAARSLWLKSGGTLLIILVLLVVDRAVGAIIEHLARQRRRADDKPVDPSQPSRWSLLQQGRHFVRLTLMLVGLLVVQHLYGIDRDLFGALHSLHLLEVGQYQDGQPVWLTLGDVIAALLIIAGAMLIVRHLPGLCEVVLFPRVPWDAGLRYAFLTLSRYILLCIAIWWSLSMVHLRWSSIQWIIAAVSVGVGFGLQEIVSNFISGLILLIERPIRVNDTITVGDQSGTVKRITIRATAIQNVDNQTVIIPNKEFIAGRVTNWTLGNTPIRLVVTVGVAYGSDLELVKRLLTEAVVSHPRVLKYPPPAVLLRAFGDSSLAWEIWCFVPKPEGRVTAAHDLLLQIDQTFRQHGITIPFPQHDLHLRSADTAIEVRPQGNGYASAPAAQD
jgi:potassium efflux system protein